MFTINQLNKTSLTQFIESLGDIFEHSPWIADKAYTGRPFSSIEHLYQEMIAVVEQSTPEQKLTLIKAHPNLGDRAEMSDNSIQEQAGAGLKDLTALEYKNFISLNKKYMDKFGFPFILAVRGKDKQQIYDAMETRIGNDAETEFLTAIQEIYKIALFRLNEKISKED